MERLGEKLDMGRLFRFYTVIVLSFFISLGMAGPPLKAEEGAKIDILGVPQGTVTLNYSLDQGKKCKVMIEKSGKTLYYNLKGTSGTETFPLQMGNGTYTVAVLENVSGTQYRYLTKETVALEQEDPLEVYLQSVQLIKWDRDDPVIEQAGELTQSMGNDLDKLEAVYGYIVNNYKYDYDKLGKLPSDYVPDINSTYKTKKGLCYDFAALCGGMLRSVGIPAKLVKGYGKGIEGYHAWNEVYVDGQWKLIDISGDIQMKEGGQKYSMFKDAEKYDKVKEF